MFKILITGCSGLVGSNLYTKFKENNFDVYGVARTDRYNLGTICADLTDSVATEELFKKIKPDIVYHLAANASEARGQISPIDMVQRNVGLSTNVLRSAINHGVKKFIFSSSISVYGDMNRPWVENHSPRPRDVYGANKLAFEHILKIMAKVYKFDYTIFRPHNIYGHGQNMADPSKNVIALFMRRLLENKSYILYGGGEMKRAFSYVDDVVLVFFQALTKFSQKTINIGSTQSITIKELSDLLIKITGITVPIDYEPLRPQEMSVFLADHRKQGVEFKYHETPIEKGLKETWDWVKSRPLPEIIKMENEICLPQK